MTITSDPTDRTQINAPAGLPIIELAREFDAPVEHLFRAHVDPQLFVRWVGPRSIDSQVQHWDCRTGGSYRYTSSRHGEQVAAFYGSFHEVRENERLVQTFTYVGAPDAVALEIMTLEALPGGRSRLRSVSVGASVADRDAMIASGMEAGVREGYRKLDELLASRA